MRYFLSVIVSFDSISLRRYHLKQKHTATERIEARLTFQDAYRAPVESIPQPTRSNIFSVSPGALVIRSNAC
jgi:hypothetical protein